MLITCPYCGPRDLVEFTYQGDGNRTRPDPASTDQAGLERLCLRPAEPGRRPPRDLAAFRAAAARIWPSRRDTLTHKISSVGFARDAGHRRSDGHRRHGAGMSPRRDRHRRRPDRPRQDVRFTFDGKPYVGHAGDTLASALLANGVSLFGRSFKYHRPRGVLAAGIDEPNALVTVLKGDIREPNIPATLLEIHDGLTVVSQNRFPSLGLRCRRGQPAGRQADLGRLLLQDLHGAGDRPAEGHAVLDVLRACSSAAPPASAAPARPGHGALRAHERLLRRAGGRLRPGRADGRQGRRRARPARHPGRARRALRRHRQLVGRDDRRHAGRGMGRRAAVEELAGRGNVRLLNRTTVWGYYDDNTLAALERVTDHKARRRHGRAAPPPLVDPRRRRRAGDRRLRAAAGVSRQRPAGRDAGRARPNATPTSSAWSPGDKAGVFTNNDGAYRAAAALPRPAAPRSSRSIDVRGEISPEARRPRWPPAGSC